MFTNTAIDAAARWSGPDVAVGVKAVADALGLIYPDNLGAYESLSEEHVGHPGKLPERQ